MASFETFKLSELRLDQKNYRTGATATQRDAIAAIIEDQKARLVNLAEDILSVGLSPGEPAWVTRDTDAPGMYVVLEGNRRVAALKLMDSPALADGTIVEGSFATLAKQFSEHPIREVEARVFATRDEAKPWQRRRHLTSASGVGLQGWKPLAKARANRDQGERAPRFLAVVEYLQDDTEEWADLSDVLDSKWTTVDRVLNASTLQSVLGIAIDLKTGVITFENGEEEAGKNLLRQILHEISAPEFRFSHIESDVDRESFINRFVGSSVKAKSGTNPGSGKSCGAATLAVQAKSSAAPPKIKLTPAPRNTLAPKTGSRTFQVDGDRLNSLYRECREISVKGNENAAAFLLRVFIELSSEALLVEKGIAIPASIGKGKTNWDDIGITLSAKVGAVLDVMTQLERPRHSSKPA